MFNHLQLIWLLKIDRFAVKIMRKYIQQFSIFFAFCGGGAQTICICHFQLGGSVISFIHALTFWLVIRFGRRSSAEQSQDAESERGYGIWAQWWKTFDEILRTMMVKLCAWLNIFIIVWSYAFVHLWQFAFCACVCVHFVVRLPFRIWRTWLCYFNWLFLAWLF